MLVAAVWMLGSRPTMTEGGETDGAILGVGIRLETHFASGTKRCRPLG